MHQRETGSKIQASGASNAGTFQSYGILQIPFVKNFAAKCK